MRRLRSGTSPTAPNPYSSLYGSLWADGGDDHASSSSSSSMLVVPRGDGGVMASGPRALFMGELAPFGEADGCLSGSAVLKELTKNLFYREQILVVVIIPISVREGGGGGARLHPSTRRQRMLASNAPRLYFPPTPNPNPNFLPAPSRSSPSRWTPTSAWTLRARCASTAARWA